MFPNNHGPVQPNNISMLLLLYLICTTAICMKDIVVTFVLFIYVVLNFEPLPRHKKYNLRWHRTSEESPPAAWPQATSETRICSKPGNPLVEALKSQLVHSARPSILLTSATTHSGRVWLVQTAAASTNQTSSKGKRE